MYSVEGSLTARVCAWARAYSSKTENNSTLSDPLAYRIIEDDEKILRKLLLSHRPLVRRFSKQSLLNLILPIPLSRSLWADKEFRAFHQDREVIQYLILGAGLDTFTLKNKDQSVRIFEVDQSSLQNIKVDRLSRLGYSENATFVSLDLRHDSLEERLKAYGFNPHLKTFITLMGVSYYINLKPLVETLRSLYNFMDSFTLLFDFYEHQSVSDSSSRFESLKAFTSSLGEPMASGYVYENLKAELLNIGYDISHISPSQIEERFLRGRIKGITAYENVHFLKISKQ